MPSFAAKPFTFKFDGSGGKKESSNSTKDSSSEATSSVLTNKTNVFSATGGAGKTGGSDTDSTNAQGDTSADTSLLSRLTNRLGSKQTTAATSTGSSTGSADADKGSNFWGLDVFASTPRGSTGATDTMGTAGGQLMDLGLSFTDELKNVDQIPDVDRLGDLLMKEDDEEGAVLVSSPSRKPADANTTMTGSEEYDPNNNVSSY